MCHLIDSNDRNHVLTSEESCNVRECCPTGWTDWDVFSVCHDAGAGPYQKILERRRYDHSTCLAEGKELQTEWKTVDCDQVGKYGTGKCLSRLKTVVIEIGSRDFEKIMHSQTQKIYKLYIFYKQFI